MDLHRQSDTGNELDSLEIIQKEKEKKKLKQLEIGQTPLYTTWSM